MIEKLVALIMFLIVAGLALIPIDCVTGTDRVESVTIVDRSFTPASSSVGTGISSSGNVVTTVSSEPEKWTVIVNRSGALVPVTGGPGVYATARPGMRATLKYRRGGVLGWETGAEVTIP